MGWRSVADAPVRPAKDCSGNRRDVTLPLQPIGDARQSVLGLANQGHIESAIERLVGTNGGVCAAGNQQPVASSQPLDQTIGVPNPAGKETNTDDPGSKTFRLLRNPFRVVEE